MQDEQLHRIFEDVEFISHVVKRFNHADYELYKKRIDNLDLEPAAHDKAIRKLTEVMEL